MGIQKASQIRPAAPVMRKADCQPHLRGIHGTTRGATMAPTLVPALKMPVARARSRLGNHSATDFIAAGKLPASAKPRAKRAVEKPKTERTKAWATAAALQRISERP